MSSPGGSPYFATGANLVTFCKPDPRYPGGEHLIAVPPSELGMEEYFILLIVPQSLLASTQKCLRKKRGHLPRAKLVSYLPPFTKETGVGDPSRLLNERYFKVPTGCPTYSLRSLESSLDRGGLAEEYDAGHISYVVEKGPLPSPKGKPSANKLNNLIRDWIQALSSKDGGSLSLPDHGTKSYKYILYDTLLLLPVEFRERMGDLLNHTQIQDLYEVLSKAFKKPRIAINKPIASKRNRKRSPSLIPLFGDFGAFVPEQPSQQDLTTAYWERNCQNGITQVWAPLYTMFSNGNLSEKKRILELESLKQEEDYSAVDLYAGIGYFAFSYAKAGASKVLCWDINAWSVEGMRRGAEANGWTCQVVSGADTVEDQELRVNEEARLIAFHEDNIKAAKRVKALRRTIPPVRHVNCGFLPSSKDSWETAIRVLDPKLGGWIHVHENIRITRSDCISLQLSREELWEKAKERIIWDIDELIEKKWTARGMKGDTTWQVSCSHLEKVKEFAPCVYHGVFDIHVEYHQAAADP